MKVKSVLLCIIVLAFISFAQADAALINLGAIGAIASANNVYSTYTADKAIDGDDTTYWNGGDHTNNWLKVDLGALYDVDTVVLKSRDSAEFSSSYYINYILSYSSDESVWSVAGSGTLYDDPVNYLDSIDLGGSALRYLEFAVPSGTHWSHLHEMEVYGSKHGSDDEQPGDVPVPEPATMLMLGLGSLSLLRFRKK